MKKSIIIPLIAVTIIVTIVGIIFINLNKEKTSITASDFYTTMSQKEYNVQDSSNQFSEYNYVKQAYIAGSKNNSYQIEFYELEDDSYATQFYNNNKSIFESSKGTNSVESNVELKNYSKYTLSSNGKYMIVSRIDNTVIYVNVDNNYKDAVNSLLKDLGY